ncbi:MAG: hypothetical protein ACKO6B_14240 [Planctomycetia bacterium]
MITESIDPSDSLSARDRVRRARALAMSPAQRLAAMRRLLAQSKELLERSPAGLAHFRRRNFAARAFGRKAGMDGHDA